MPEGPRLRRADLREAAPHRAAAVRERGRRLALEDAHAGRSVLHLTGELFLIL
jgi:hypothetical protein